MTDKKQSGNNGEDYAEKWLISRKYKILHRNYHSRYGEIDIIASDEKYIVFVEVKTRSIGSYGLPREAVTLQKQRKIIRTAYCFLAANECNLQPRFDVIEVYLKNKNDMRPYKMTHLKGAFESDGDDDYALF